MDRFFACEWKISKIFHNAGIKTAHFVNASANVEEDFGGANCEYRK